MSVGIYGQRRRGTYRLEILDSGGQLRILFLGLWPVVMHRNVDIGLARPAVADEHVLFALFALCQLCLVGVVACAFEPYFGRVAACAVVVRGVLQQLREREPCERWRGRRPSHGGVEEMAV